MNPIESLPLPVPSQNGHAEPVPASALLVPSDEASQVMLQFQGLMSQFLETQRAVMLGYLQGGTGEIAAPSIPAIHANGVIGNGHVSNGHGPLPYAEMNGRAPQTFVAAQPIVTPNLAPAEVESDRVADAPKSSAVAETPTESAPQPTRAWLEAQLTEMISKRTGYPKEMLNHDLDLEGDLGIDSIKRVEILGTLAEMLGGGEGSMSGDIELEKLTTIKTLRGILDYLEQALGGGQGNKPAATAPSAPTASLAPVESAGTQQHEIQRGMVRLTDAPLPSGGSMLIPNGAVVLTDDGRGIARELAGRLADFGQRTAIIKMSTAGEPDQGETFYANLADPQAVDHLILRLRQSLGPIAGLVHLLPFAAPPAEENQSARVRREVKSLYLLARGLEEDLRRAGKEGGAFLLAPTALGGSLGFGDGPLGEGYFAGQGGILGFVKCLGMEWPEVLVRAADFAADRPAMEVAERLLGELGDSDGPLEIGYQGNRRITWEPISALLTADSNAIPVLEPGSTVLVTGGARGITATIAQELASRYKPNLVIVGRSSPPAESESAETAALGSMGEIKAALIARAQRDGKPVVPSAIDAEYNRLMTDREIRGNLSRIRHAGATVEYRQLDVRDEAAFEEVISEIETRYGGIDGVIHGAGVIEDKLVRDKTPESFERVVSTKVDSALFLARRLKPERLKFCVFFASIASRYGNRGQADYAAANEILSKLAVQLDRAWPARVVSIAWGPWSGVGMVSELEKHLVARGLKLISPEVGPKFLLDELAYGKKGQTEVMIAGGAEHAVRPGKSRTLAGPHTRPATAATTV